MTQKLLLDASPGGKARFHRPDIWHTIHLGVAKHYVASAFSILVKALPQSNQDLRFEALSKEFKARCTQNRKTRYISHVSADLFSISGNQEPIGTWNKAHTSGTLMEFMEEFCKVHRDELQGLDDDRVKYIAAWLHPVTQLLSSAFVSLPSHGLISQKLRNLGQRRAMPL